MSSDWCDHMFLVTYEFHGPCVNSFYLLWPKLFFFRVCICVTFIHCILGLFWLFFFFFKNPKKEKENQKKWVFVLYIFKMCNWGWPMKFAFHDCVPCLTLMSFIFLHFVSLCNVVLILCELFMVFNHMLLILKSHSFDYKD